MQRRPARVADEVLAHGQHDHRVPGLDALALHPEQAVERGVLLHEAQHVERVAVRSGSRLDPAVGEAHARGARAP